MLVSQVSIFAGHVQFSLKKDFSADFPVVEMQIVADLAMIEHGRYLA